MREEKNQGVSKINSPVFLLFPQLPHIEIASITFVSRELTVLPVNKNISASIRTMPCLGRVFEGFLSNNLHSQIEHSAIPKTWDMAPSLFPIEQGSNDCKITLN